MRLETARRFALTLPETTEEPHFEKSSFRVKGKIFATVPLGGKTLHVNVDRGDAKALIAENPKAFEAILTAKGAVIPEWLRVNLPAAERDEVCELLEDAWRLKAPKRVLDAFEAQRGA